MVQFIQDFFLSPVLIMFILLIVFLMLSTWALRRRKEYLGYGLGWLIGVFAMVVYGALVGDPPEPEATAQAVEIGGVTLNLFQVIFPSLIGIMLGAGAMASVNVTQNKGVQQSILVAILTAISLMVLFLMVVSSAYPVSQRMIGLFALAFAIGAVTMMVVYRQQGTHVVTAQGATGDPFDESGNRNMPSMRGNNALGNRIRDRIDRQR